jgi:hypothetical protein
VRWPAIPPVDARPARMRRAARSGAIRGQHSAPPEGRVAGPPPSTTFICSRSRDVPRYSGGWRANPLRPFGTLPRFQQKNQASNGTSYRISSLRELRADPISRLHIRRRLLAVRCRYPGTRTGSVVDRSARSPTCRFARQVRLKRWLLRRAVRAEDTKVRPRLHEPSP